eukprot:1156454-Pelagomonas_calceolata.AAC.9
MQQVLCTTSGSEILSVLHPTDPLLGMAVQSAQVGAVGGIRHQLWLASFVADVPAVCCRVAVMGNHCPLGIGSVENQLAFWQCKGAET